MVCPGQVEGAAVGGKRGQRGAQRLVGQRRCRGGQVVADVGGLSSQGAELECRSRAGGAGFSQKAAAERGCRECADAGQVGVQWLVSGSRCCRREVVADVGGLGGQGAEFQGTSQTCGAGLGQNTPPKCRGCQSGNAGQIRIERLVAGCRGCSGQVRRQVSIVRFGVQGSLQISLRAQKTGDITPHRRGLRNQLIARFCCIHAQELSGLTSQRQAGDGRELRASVLLGIPRRSRRDERIADGSALPGAHGNRTQGGQIGTAGPSAQGRVFDVLQRERGFQGNGIDAKSPRPRRHDR